MGYTYTWKLNSLKKMKSGSYNDIIFGTTWQVIGTDENGIEGNFSGATPFRAEDVNPNEFIPYNELNEEIVLGWVKNEVSGSGVSAYFPHIEQMIKEQIDNKVHQVTEVHLNNFPWTPSGSAAPTM